MDDLKFNTVETLLVLVVVEWIWVFTWSTL